MRDNESIPNHHQYARNIATTKARVDSLRSLQPQWEARYTARDTSTVAALVVRCRYNYRHPKLLLLTKQERTISSYRRTGTK